MEEDIEYLENMIKRLDKNAFDIYRKAPNVNDYLGTITGKEILAIENLINRNKELEYELMQKDLEIIGKEEYTKANMKEIIEHYYIAKENSVPKSVIKEKIEEYKKLLMSCNRVFDVDRIKAINERILELQELLEGRK